MGHSPSLCIKQRQCEIAEKPQVSTAEAVTENETVEEAEDEFDESSDEEVDDDPEVSSLVQGEIGSPRRKNSLRESGAFQQPSALLNSSNAYVNFERLETPSVLRAVNHVIGLIDLNMSC